jgi:hypothetical protein
MISPARGIAALRLDVERQVADLVEEQRAADRRAESVPADR